MFKTSLLLFLLALSAFASDKCFSVQILEVDKKYLIENKIEQNVMPSDCRLMNINETFYGRCGCYSSKKEATKSIAKYPNLSKSKPTVEETFKYRFKLKDVSFRQFDKKKESKAIEAAKLSTTLLSAKTLPETPPTQKNIIIPLEHNETNTTDVKTISSSVDSALKKVSSDLSNTGVQKNITAPAQPQKVNSETVVIENTEIRIPLQFMKQVIIILGALSVLTFFIIILYKIYVEKQQRNVNKLKSNIQADIEKAIKDKNFNKEKFLTPISKTEFYSFADVAIDFINNVMSIGSGSKSNIHNLLDDKNVIKYLKNLSKNKWSLSRIESIEKLGLMHYEKNKFFLFSLIENEASNSRIVKQAIIGLSYIIRQDDVRFFLDEFIKTKASGKYLEFVFTNIIQRMVDLKQEEGVLDILYYLYQIENNQVFIRPFVEAIGYTGFDYIQDEFYDLYFMSQSNNVKSSIVRAIGTLKQNDKCDEVILLALKSEDEIIRIAASKSLSVVDVSKHYDDLKDILLDKNYNVRLNAAVALSQSANGLALLETIFKSSNDIYAKEMAKYAIVVAERDRNNKPKIVQ